MTTAAKYGSSTNDIPPDSYMDVELKINQFVPQPSYEVTSRSGEKLIRQEFTGGILCVR